MLIDPVTEETWDTPMTTEPMEERLSSDALLQASRRVDWRFLLPDPSLGRVAYFGPVDSEQAKSLRLFSQTFIALQDDWSAESYQRAEASFDVVVVERPSRQSLPVYANLVRPGGYIYLEVYGSSWSAPRKVKRREFRIKGLNKLRPHRFEKPLEHLGFVEIANHWHWPTFEGCTKMIPLADETAVRFALANEKKSRKAKIQNLVSKGVLQTGLLPQLVPCYSVIGKRWG
ncbi:MAG: hypothetical protein AAF614_18165 [Chloroflexota bacterium]